MLRSASRLGLAIVHGTCTRADVLRAADVPTAAAVVVAADRADSTLLITLTVRELAELGWATRSRSEPAGVTAALVATAGVATAAEINRCDSVSAVVARVPVVT